jgi:hypothetical protein
MTNRNIIANGCAKLLKCAMDHYAILHIHFVADANEIYIAPHNGIKPHAAIITHDHIAYNGCIRRQKTIAAKLGMFVFNWKYHWHSYWFLVVGYWLLPALVILFSLSCAVPAAKALVGAVALLYDHNSIRQIIAFCSFSLLFS